MQKERVPSPESAAFQAKSPDSSITCRAFSSSPRVGAWGNIVLPQFAAVLRGISQGVGPSSLSRSLGVQTQPVFGLCSFGPLETPGVDVLTRGG